MGDGDTGNPRGPSREPPAGLTEIPTTEGSIGGEPRVAIGDCLGRYTLRARLGAGSMGEVFEAHDPELDRRVAIKVLKAEVGGATPEARARFQREAQAMARLNDPNVVAVYDVDTLGERLFVAMELVPGPTLAEWIARGPHPWRRVVEVFAQAGRGLAAAHDAGIIHRDFKPSNVILGDRVRVADFGLARALGSGERAAPTTATVLACAVTLTGETLGTPAYMAPEQRAGGAVTSAADQYAFCLALDEALAGSGAPPFLRQLIARGRSADPAQRFPSMRALLVELARDPARARRRVAVAVAGLAVIAAGVLLIRRDQPPACGPAAVRLAGVWDAPRRAAVIAAFAATRLSYSADTWPRVTAQLDGYAGRWADMANEACRATRVEGRQSDAMLDLRMACLERRRAQLGDLVALWSRGVDKDGVLHAAAAAQGLPAIAECADTRALGDRAPLPTDPGAVARITAARRSVDDVRTLTLAHRWTEARAKAGPARALADATGWPQVRAEAAFAAGDVLALLSDPTAHAALLDAAQLAGEAHDDHLHAYALVVLIDVLGSDDQQAQRALLLADVAQSVLARAGDDPVLVARLLAARASALQIAGKLDEARDALLRARAQITDSEPVSLVVIGKLIQVDTARGDFAAAVELGKQAIAMTIARAGAEHPKVAEMLAATGKASLWAGNPSAALGYYQRALPILEAAAGSESTAVAGVHGAVGAIEKRLGHSDAARAAFERSIAIYEKLLGPNHPALCASLDNLADLQRKTGRVTEAIALHERALAIETATYGANGERLVYTLTGLGHALADRGDQAGALGYFRRAAAVAEKALGKDHPEALGEQIYVGNALADQHRCQDAMAVLTPGIAALARKPEAAQNEDLAIGLTAAARCDLSAGESARALERVERALAILDKAQARSYAHGEVHAVQARALWAIGRRDEATAAAREAEAELPTEASGATVLAELRAWSRTHGATAAEPERHAAVH